MGRLGSDQMGSATEKTEGWGISLSNLKEAGSCDSEVPLMRRVSENDDNHTLVVKRTLEFPFKRLVVAGQQQVFLERPKDPNERDGGQIYVFTPDSLPICMSHAFENTDQSHQGWLVGVMDVR